MDVGSSGVVEVSGAGSDVVGSSGSSVFVVVDVGSGTDSVGKVGVSGSIQ